MRFRVPSNWTWFFPQLKKKYEFMKDVDWHELFKEKTESLLKQLIKQDASALNKLIGLLLTERFFLENIEEGFFLRELLEPILEKEKIRGYLLKTDFEEFRRYIFNGKKEDVPGFVKVDEGVFLWVAEWGNPLSWLIYLWNKGLDFLCVEIILEKFQQLDHLSDVFKVPKKLDFSYLTLSSAEKLRSYLPALSFSQLLEFQEAFPEKGKTLVLGKKLPELKDLGNIIEEISHKYQVLQSLEDEDKILLLLKERIPEGSLPEFLEKTERCFSKLGILDEDTWERFRIEGASPLIYLVGAFEHASRVSEKAISFEGFTLHVIGDLYYEWEDLGQALKYYLAAKPYTKQPIELALSEGAIYYRLGNLDLAEKVLKEGLCGCIKEDPAVHYNLGLVFLKRENYQEAKYHFYKAHLLDPKNPLFRETLTQFLWDTLAYDELEELIYSVKDLTSRERILLGKLYFYKKEYSKAFEILREFLDHPQRDGECSLFLAWLYLYFNKEKQAAEVLLKEARKVLGKDFEKILKEFDLEIKC